MARRRKGERVLGPYWHGHSSRWLIFLVAPDGSRDPRYFAKKAQAAQVKRAIEEQIHSEEFTTESARDKYEQHLIDEGNKANSRYCALYAIKRFFPEPIPLWALTEKKCKERYKELRGELAVDTHRNILAQTKTFLRWCVEKRWISKSHLEGVQGVGKRNKRKPQLRIKSARKWYSMALELAEGGDEGAIAALMTILLGMRCSEIVTRKVFDVDEEDEPGDLIHIPDEDAKSDGGTLEVPEDLRAFLVRLTIGKKPDDYLFPARSKTGAHWRDWPRKQVQRICRLAGVKEVSAHAMRGALATIALRRGTAPSAVQETLRHKDIKTTTGSYAERGAAEQGERVRGLHLLKGGKR